MINDMRKKLLIIAGIVITVAITATIWGTNSSLHTNLFAQENDNKNESHVINGPAESYTCPGWFTGVGYACMAENSYSCALVACK